MINVYLQNLYHIILYKKLHHFELTCFFCYNAKKEEKGKTEIRIYIILLILLK